MKFFNLSYIVVGTLLFTCNYLNDLHAATWPGGEFLQEEFSAEAQDERYAAHPFVALPRSIAEADAGSTLVSPEPNQLRVVDLRGVECYPQPDNLVVCGAGDTTCFLLFTKSEEPLQDIEFIIRFGEGIEYGGFAEINFGEDAVFPAPQTSLNLISDQNPEAPSFLISDVSRDSGAVYICYGIRAECGVDIENNPPFINYEWRYTTLSGLECEDGFDPPQSFSGNIIVPRVQFTQTSNFPNNINLGAINQTACQQSRITQTTPDGSATGYIFTADNYGFEDGVSINDLRLNGTSVPVTEFTIDSMTGVLTANLDRSDDPLEFNEIENIDVCYTYSACIPNVDYSPLYSVVSACEGVLCTGPADFASRNESVRSNFPGPADVQVSFDQTRAGTSDPNIAGDIPYVFDILLETNGDVPIVDDLYNLRVRARACASSILFLDSIQVIDEVTDAPLGTLDPSVASVRTTDAGSDPAGTLDIRLSRNTTLMVGDLVDIDGDGSFDDILAGGSVRLRVTYSVVCGTDDLGNITSSEPGENMDCQFTQLFANANSGCGFVGESDAFNIGGEPDLTVSSTASFVGGDISNFNGFTGYNFGTFGNQPGGGGSCNPRPVATRSIVFNYNLGDNPLVACPNDDGTSKLVLVFSGDPSITEDAAFSNFGFDVDNDGVADQTLATGLDTNVIYPEEGTVIIEILNAAGGGNTEQELNFLLDISFDTAFCSPAQILFMSGLISTECASGSACDLIQTSASIPFRVDPADCDCDCYIEQFVTARRISRGFTDATRTTQVEQAAVDNGPDRLRFLPGDSLEITAKYHILPDAANSTRYQSELAIADRTLVFTVDFDPANTTNFNGSDNRPNLVDYQLSRLQRFSFTRAGVETDLGSQFSGPTQNLGATGLILGAANSTTANSFPRDNEIIQPAFPNGGYTFGTGDDTRQDNRDGNRLIIQLRNLGSDNRALDQFNSFVGGALMPGDTVTVVWNAVLLDNPGQVATVNGAPNPPQPMIISSRVDGSVHLNEAAGLRYFFGENGCPDQPAALEYFSPQVVAESRVDYADECEANVRLIFRNTQPPAGWFANEFRPINGIEQVNLAFPAPYFNGGGTTVQAVGVPPIPIFPDSTFNVDTAIVAGVESYAPNQATGRVLFRDAEFVDSVRSDGYANFDQGENDITTVGGTFPLIGVGGQSGIDSLVFNFPIRRLCGDEPINSSALSATYNWANRHLGDYEDFPYRVNTSSQGDDYWEDKPTQNDGSPALPDNGFNANGTPAANIQFYFPFQRLQDDPDDEVNPHREINRTTTYTIVNPPAPLTATTSSSTIVDGGQLADTDGAPEVNSFTITPGDGQILAGSVLVSVGTGGELQSVTASGTPLDFALLTINDSTAIYSFPVPAGLTADETFAFDLTTDLLFCTAAQICITPILGCADDPILSAAAFAAFSPSCNTMMFCYTYMAGAAEVVTTFQEPLELPLCETQSLEVQYFNNGSSDLFNFSPILFIPEGLEVSNFAFAVTGGATGPLSDPTFDPANPDAVEVFGEGLTFTQSEIDAAVNSLGAGFNPGEVLTISFDARTTCDFVSGLPLVSNVVADGACGLALESTPTFSSNIDVALPPQPQTLFTFEPDNEPLEISCSDDGDNLILTISNVGKADAGSAEICLRLPDGVDINLAEINALSPAGYTVDEADVTSTPINSGGSVQRCFPAPRLPGGGFVCLEIPFLVGAIECGPVFVGATLITEEEAMCANAGPNDTNPCTISVSTNEDIYFELIVVPGATANDANLTATCTDVPGVFDVNFDFEFIAESQPFDGDVVLQLYSDVDANGEFDADIDTQIGSDQTVSIMLAQDEAQMFAGVFPGVDQSEICPLLLRIESLGCTCSESILSFPAVLPDFLDDLGDAVVLCPGEPFTFEGICADLTYAFDPVAAGSITVDDATGEATITINDGFGVGTPVDLNITGVFGTCGLEKTIEVSNPGTVGFGPYEYSVCNTGRQEVDLNIPRELQEDISVEILDPVGITNPNSVEPVIEDLQESMVYDVVFSFNDGACTETTTLTVTVDEAVEVTVNDLTGCSTGVDLSERVTVTPATTPGVFESNGDGSFVPSNVLVDETGAPQEVRYLPGPQDKERGFVNLRFITSTPEGPCGPGVGRFEATILLVDCGAPFWDGTND